MPSKTQARIRIKRLQDNLRLTRPIVVLAFGVLVPVLLSTSLGIVALALGKSSLNLLFGVLAVSLAAAAVGSAVVVAVLLGRRARTARLQSDLLGNVTHELKTPLAAIRMYAQTLQMGVVDQDPELTRTCVDTIVRETEWLGTMIERLLTWRTAAKDRYNLELITAPIDDVAEEVAARFSRMLAPGQVEFECRVETQLPVLHDRSGIGTILINLLTNAYKYTGEEKRIRMTVEDQQGQIVISVRDNGIGIPADELDEIFEPFHRVESRLQSRAAGAGLGLAIVDFMVKAHSGSIDVESVPGEGSVFVVRFPAARSEEAVA